MGNNILEKIVNLRMELMLKHPESNFSEKKIVNYIKNIVKRKKLNLSNKLEKEALIEVLIDLFKIEKETAERIITKV